MVQNKKKTHWTQWKSKLIEDPVLPYFVIEGKSTVQPIKSMPGVNRFSVDELVKDVDSARQLGIKTILLFGVVSNRKKDDLGGNAFCPDDLISRAVKEIKDKIRGVTVITDVCLCAYTTHGHCGILTGHEGAIDRRKTLKALSEMALRHAEAGADWVAPSAMAKGQVAAIRQKLDSNGFHRVNILGYSAKFASVFYGPFREAAKSAPAFGDRREYQFASADSARALRRIAADIREGADMVMVKPALAYLDVIRQAKEKFRVPVAAYNVSGEYALMKLGAKKGYWDEQAALAEIMTSIRRAGADVIISYHAKDIVRRKNAEKKTLKSFNGGE